MKNYYINIEMERSSWRFNNKYCGQEKPFFSIGHLCRSNVTTQCRQGIQTVCQPKVKFRENSKSMRSLAKLFRY